MYVECIHEIPLIIRRPEFPLFGRCPLFFRIGPKGLMDYVHRYEVFFPVGAIVIIHVCMYMYLPTYLGTLYVAYWYCMKRTRHVYVYLHTSVGGVREGGGGRKVE